MKIKNKIFRDPIFMSAFTIVIQCREKGVPGKTKYDVKKMHRTMQEHIDDYNELRKEIQEQYGKLDHVSGNYIFQGDAEDRATKEIKELEEQEFEYNRPPITCTDALMDRLCGQDIDVLEEYDLVNFDAYYEEGEEPEVKERDESLS